MQISDLTSPDRVEIFKHLAVDELGEISESILAKISAESYDSFIEFCEKVYAEKDTINEVSCSVTPDGQLQYEIDYK